MSCTNPLRAFNTGYVSKETGKPIYYISSKKDELIHKPRSADVAKSQKFKDVYTDIIIKEYIEVPCGKCQSCRLDYSKEWMQRCMLEQTLWEHNEMLTLTYNDENLPKQKGIDLKTGEYIEQSSLNKEDVQKFLKDLRRYWKYHYDQDNIRFYMCGEYGDLKGRPHYHLLMFNFEVHDKEFFKYSKKGFKMYHSQVIEDIWGKGHIELNEVNAETCAYVARYIMKKQKGPGAKETYEIKGQVPEYTNGSRKPGIGGLYYEQNKEKIYKNDGLYLNTGKRIEKIKPSKYYDRLYDADEHEIMEHIKEIRKRVNEARQDTQVAVSGLSIDEIRKNKENALKERLKKLSRSSF